MSAATGGVASDKCLWENITAFMAYRNGSQGMGMKFMMYVKKEKGEKFYGKTISRYVVEIWRNIQNAFDEQSAF